VFFHHTYKRSAKYEHHIAVLENFIPGVLKYRRERVVYLYKIRKFIYNQNLFLVRLVIGNGLKQIQPIRKSGFLQYGIARCSGNYSGKPFHALRLNLFRGKEIKCGLTLYKLLYKRCFSYTPAAVYYNKATVSGIFLFKVKDFFFSSEKFHFISPSILHNLNYDNLNYIITNYFKKSIIMKRIKREE